jgi:hypothetical protein
MKALEERKKMHHDILRRNFDIFEELNSVEVKLAPLQHERNST